MSLPLFLVIWFGGFGLLMGAWPAWSRFGPVKPIAKTAVELLDAGIGWTRSGYSTTLRHATGLTVTDYGTVLLCDEAIDLPDPSRCAVKRAFERYRERERQAKLVAAARQFADNAETYANKVVSIRKDPA